LAAIQPPAASQPPHSGRAIAYDFEALLGAADSQTGKDTGQAAPIEVAPTDGSSVTGAGELALPAEVKTTPDAASRDQKRLTPSIEPPPLPESGLTGGSVESQPAASTQPVVTRPVSLGSPLAGAKAARATLKAETTVSSCLAPITPAVAPTNQPAGHIVTQTPTDASSPPQTRHGDKSDGPLTNQAAPPHIATKSDDTVKPGNVLNVPTNATDPAGVPSSIADAANPWAVKTNPSGTPAPSMANPNAAPNADGTIRQTNPVSVAAASDKPSLPLPMPGATAAAAAPPAPQPKVVEGSIYQVASNGISPLVAPPATASGRPDGPTAAPPANAGEQLAVRVAQALNDGGKTMTVELHPAELGHVEIHFSFHSNGMDVRVTIDRPETFDAFSRDHGGLERQLAQAGVNLGGGGLDLRLGQQPNSPESYSNARSSRLSMPAASTVVAPAATWVNSNLVDIIA